MPRRTDSQSGRAETPIYDAPPSTEGGAAGVSAWSIFSEAMDIAPLCRAPATKEINFHALAALQDLVRRSKAADIDGLSYTSMALHVNIENFFYRCSQCFKGKPSPREFRELMFRMPHIEPYPGERYWRQLERVSTLVRAYREGWHPQSQDHVGAKDNRMQLAMVAAAEHLGIRSAPQSSGARAIGKARQFIREHARQWPIIFYWHEDAFLLNPGIIQLLQLPSKPGRPPKLNL